MSGKPDIAIIGGGKVGTALGVLAAKAGYRVVAVACRSLEHAKAAARRIGPQTRGLPTAKAASAGRLVLLTVPDEAIAGVCGELVKGGALAKGAIVAHCCGAMGSDVLAAARDRAGCAIGAMHPLQTFPTVEAAVEKLPGAWCFIDGDDVAAEALAQLAEAIGGRPHRIDPAGKALYHASAVMACNHAAALLDAALALAEAAGIDRATAWSAMAPLVRATVENVAAMGPAEALTGPVARGDAATIRRHIEAMKDLPAELREFYRAAARWTVDLARRKGSIDETAARKLIQSLKPQQGKE